MPVISGVYSYRRFKSCSAVKLVTSRGFPYAPYASTIKGDDVNDNNNALAIATTTKKKTLKIIITLAVVVVGSGQ
jgi:hypothetical protein